MNVVETMFRDIARDISFAYDINDISALPAFCLDAKATSRLLH